MCPPSHDMWIRNMDYDKFLERKLLNAQRGIEKLMLGISPRGRVRATWIRKQTKVKDILWSEY